MNVVSGILMAPTVILEKFATKRLDIRAGDVAARKCVNARVAQEVWTQPHKMEMLWRKYIFRA
jgi:hypothetical protein